MMEELLKFGRISIIISKFCNFSIKESVKIHDDGEGLGTSDEKVAVKQECKNKTGWDVNSNEFGSAGDSDYDQFLQYV